MSVRFSAMVLVSLLAVSCASSENGNSVRFVDTDIAVADALVTPLVGARGADGQITSFALDVNHTATRTSDAGAFEIEYQDVPVVAGLQVTIEVPSELGDAVGRLDWRTAIDATATLDLELPQPTACSGIDQDCGTPLLPDLTPIVGFADLDPAVSERLQPASTGPPTAGLFPSDTWFETDENGRRLLRFATVAANVGQGPLDIIAVPGTSDTSQTWQRIWTDTWHFEDMLSGDFIFHAGHDHVHFDAFERYSLLDMSGDVVATSEKVSFCLRDSIRIVEELPSPEGAMLVDDGECAGQQQVINPGFGDHYHALLDDQWIDITGVPAGNYVVEISVDPLDLIIESDETNNVGSFSIEIQ